jgi:hypothetical protein
VKTGREDGMENEQEGSSRNDKTTETRSLRTGATKDCRRLTSSETPSKSGMRGDPQGGRNHNAIASVASGIITTPKEVIVTNYTEERTSSHAQPQTSTTKQDTMAVQRPVHEKSSRRLHGKAHSKHLMGHPSPSLARLSPGGAKKTARRTAGGATSLFGVHREVASMKEKNDRKSRLSQTLF